jgi:DNA repair photolyase
MERKITVRDFVTKSNLPVCDFAINPYVGCPFGCRYCYASFMKRFTGHAEPWGSFVDVKACAKPVGAARLTGKKVLLSSVTDPYNPFEEKHRVTRGILEQLLAVDCEVGITTKSKLILRDLDLLMRFGKLQVAVSLNTLDEDFRHDMDKASNVRERLDTVKTLHEAGIRTALFLSPMFPGITDFRAILAAGRGFADEYWFENLNLRGAFRQTILKYIAAKYPHLTGLYDEIYRRGQKDYWRDLSAEIEAYCAEHKIRYRNYFYHEALVRAKLAGAPLV